MTNLELGDRILSMYVVFMKGHSMLISSKFLFKKHISDVLIMPKLISNIHPLGESSWSTSAGL